MSRTAALDYEIAQEQVSAFGRLGKALEAALAALAEYESSNGERNATRARLVAEASDALWYFIIQREAIGLRDPRRCCATIAYPPRCKSNGRHSRPLRTLICRIFGRRCAQSEKSVLRAVILAIR